MGSLPIKPDNLADRLDELFDTQVEDAISSAELLVAVTLDIVRTELPTADLTTWRRMPGQRQQPRE